MRVKIVLVRPSYDEMPAKSNVTCLGTTYSPPISHPHTQSIEAEIK